MKHQYKEKIVMSRRRQTGGLERSMEKLERNVQQGNYYDAFQMYNSIYNRWCFIYFLASHKKFGRLANSKSIPSISPKLQSLYYYDTLIPFH